MGHDLRPSQIAEYTSDDSGDIEAGQWISGGPAAATTPRTIFLPRGKDALAGRLMRCRLHEVVRNSFAHGLVAGCSYLGHGGMSFPSCPRGPGKSSLRSDATYAATKIISLSCKPRVF